MAVQDGDVFPASRLGIVGSVTAGDVRRVRRVFKDFAGRFTLPTTAGRWVGWSNSFGPFGVAWSNDNGENADPNVDWDQRGLIVRDGDVVKSLMILGRANNNEVSDIDIRLYHMTGNNPGVGVDANGETTFTQMYSQDGILAASGRTGNINDDHEYTFSGDVTISGTGQLLLFARAATTPATNARQFRISGEIEIERDTA